MTLSSTKSFDEFKGNNITTAFNVKFMFMKNEDVEVILRDEQGVEHALVEGIDYDLSGAGNHTGGVCSMRVPPAEGQSVHVRRDPAIVQETDYPENDAFPAASHEAALDYLTMICQALSERLDRTITFRVSSAVSGVNLPEPAADKVLAWNGLGDNLENKEVLDAGGILVPVPVTQGGTGADNVTEALFNLGFGATGAALAGCESGEEALNVVDTSILRANVGSPLKAAFGAEPQVVDLDVKGIPLVIKRNHLLCSIGSACFLPSGGYPYDGTYVWHFYPNGKSINISSEFKLPTNYIEPDPNAGEVRIVVEVFNGRKSIVSIQNLEA